MPTITVRISNENKKKLLKYGTLSRSVREAVDLYLHTKRAEELMRRLEELQRTNPIRTSSAKEAALIREDRER